MTGFNCNLINFNFTVYEIYNLHKAHIFVKYREPTSFIFDNILLLNLDKEI